MRPHSNVSHASSLAALPFLVVAVVLSASTVSACDDKSSSGPAAQPSATSPAPSANVVSRDSGAIAAPSATVDDKDPISAIALGTIFRDDEDLVLDGAKETWKLEWARAPLPDCMGSGWDTCTCTGFAFGERGDMDLVRTPAGKPEERLRLDTLFAENDTRLQRWSVTRADSEGAGRTDGGGALDMIGISMRPVTSVIKFGDYDHDGRASEFLLQVAAGPCGHTPTVVIGISKGNPKLHAFGTADKPNEPLMLDHASDWEKLRGKPAADIVSIACGDHGATEQTILHVTADGDLHVKSETKKCP